MSEIKTAWISRSSASSKPWGDETSWTGTQSASVKTLTLAAGKRNSFKYNRTKDEMLICGSGRVKVYFGDEDIISKSRGDLQEGCLEPGYALIVQSHCPYRLEAIEDSVILEVSSKSEAKPLRLHDDYGREVEESSEYIQGIIDKWFPT